MASPEVLDKSLVDLVNKALSAKSPEEGRKEALRERRKNWAEFIAVADGLIEQHGIPNPQNPDETKTPPINVGGAEVSVTRITETLQYGSQIDGRSVFTAIMATPEGSISPMYLFSTDQYVPLVDYTRPNANTTVRNQFRRIASNEEVTQGLQAIKIIEANLAAPQQ